jgi:DOPA 4,5-dioxygenase
MKQEFTWMRFYSPKDRPIGPHPVPMWEADFGSFGNRLNWNIVKEFITKEHDTLSVLIHPHSTDGDYADHTKNAFWIGAVLDLRIQGWN